MRRIFVCSRVRWYKKGADIAASPSRFYPGSNLSLCRQADTRSNDLARAQRLL